MPEQYYQKNHIAAKYTNELFRLIESSGIPMTEFELQRSTTPIAIARVRIGEVYRWWKSYDWPVTIIRHGKTRSLMAIVQISEQIFTGRAVVNFGETEQYFFSLWRMRTRFNLRWDAIVKRVQGWADEVKEDRQDLWKELNQTKGFLGEEPGKNIENTPFTRDEHIEISARIKLAKEYIQTSDELTGEQVSQIEVRLNHAEEASKRIGRKDWLMLFNGAIFSLVLTDTITPQVAEHIFMLVVHGLGNLFGYGGPPPQLP
jgi:hypothetical protein